MVSNNTLRLLPESSATSILEAFSSVQYILLLIQSTATDAMEIMFVEAVNVMYNMMCGHIKGNNNVLYAILGQLHCMYCMKADIVL